MPELRDVHQGATRVLSVLMIVIGLAMIGSTLARGGGVLAVGLLLGVLFLAAGGLRLYIGRKEG
jgi:hypothetical protein